MPTIKIQCPSGHRLTLDAKHAGKNVQCPVCKVVMHLPPASAPVVIAGPAPAPRSAAPPGDAASTLRRVAPPASVAKPVRRPAQEEIEEEDDYGESPKQIKKGLKKVRQGLDYHVLKLYLIIVMVALGLIVGILFFLAPLVALGLSIVFLAVTGLGSLACLVLDIMTIIQLAACPATTRARPFAVAYIALEVVGTALVSLSLSLGSGGFQPLFASVGGLLQMGGYLTMALFLQQLAFFLKRKRLAEPVTGLMLLIAVTMFFYMLYAIGGVLALTGGLEGAPGERRAVLDPTGVTLFAIGALGMLVSGAWAFFRYLGLVTSVRNAL